MSDKGHSSDNRLTNKSESTARSNDFVLEKSIFSNIFEKDIRRVFIYKKAERLAKAIHMVSPAFAHTLALTDRINRISVGLIDAAILPPREARTSLSRELLALSSVLGIARVGGLLSAMNADLISHEAEELLQEIAAYEEPRLGLEASPTLPEMHKQATKEERRIETTFAPRARKGHIKDILKTDRREAVLSAMKDKESVYIKDISTVIRDVSEKTIQRELQKLVQEGLVTKSGSRRWTAYSLI